jgi:hypothetical protein
VNSLSLNLPRCATCSVPVGHKLGTGTDSAFARSSYAKRRSVTWHQPNPKGMRPMKIPAILYSRPVANVSAQGCLVLLAWLDATGNQDVVITAISDGRRISPESAFAQLFANGRAGATVALPWIERASRPNVPICAYAAIVATAKRPLEATHLDRGQMWSGFVRDPDANDVARLNEEYRTTVRHLVGVSADMIDSHGPTYGRPGRIEINIFERDRALRRRIRGRGDGCVESPRLQPSGLVRKAVARSRQ